MILDYLVLVFCFALAYKFRFESLSTLVKSEPYRSLLILILLTNVSTDYFWEPYKNILRRSFIKEIKAVINYVLINILLLSLILFASRSGSQYSRIVIFVTYLLFPFASLLIRQINKYLIYRRSKNAISHSNKKIVIITDSKNVKKVAESIDKYNFELYEVLGFCLLDDKSPEKEVEGHRILANKDEIMSYICHNWVDEVYIALELNKVPNSILKGLADAGVTTNILIRKLEEFEGQEQNIRKIFNTNVLTTSVKTRTNTQVFLKRTMDIIGGLVGSFITILLTIIIGPLIYVKSPGPIFYRQERIGQNGRRFYMYKFRSMVVNADELKKDLMSQNRIKDGMMFKVKGDPRIIPGIGEFIRKTSLDEFPQFFNVVIGNMSLVGTRPPTVDEWEKYRLEHRIRMAIKPGITGLWQVNGRSKITDFDKVIEYDTKYINNWSLALDIEILIKTVIVLLSKREDEAM